MLSFVKYQHFNAVAEAEDLWMMTNNHIWVIWLLVLKLEIKRAQESRQARPYLAFVQEF